MHIWLHDLLNLHGHSPGTTSFLVDVHQACSVALLPLPARAHL